VMASPSPATASPLPSSGLGHTPASSPFLPFLIITLRSLALLFQFSFHLSSFPIFSRICCLLSFLTCTLLPGFRPGPSYLLGTSRVSRHHKILWVLTCPRHRSTLRSMVNFGLGSITILFLWSKLSTPGRPRFCHPR